MSFAVESVRLFAGNWLGPLPLAEAFARPQPVEIDLGCGKGRFLLARAARHPEVNFLGVDRMLRRIRKVDRKVVRADLSNVRLLRMEAYYATLYLFPPCAVSAYYVFFPDPWPKTRHHKHRLFNGPFLDALARTLLPEGAVHVATDHAAYFDEIVALLTADARFASIDPFVPEPEEETEFEMYYRQRTRVHRHSVRRRG